MSHDKLNWALGLDMKQVIKGGGERERVSPSDCLCICITSFYMEPLQPILLLFHELDGGFRSFYMRQANVVSRGQQSVSL